MTPQHQQGLQTPGQTCSESSVMPHGCYLEGLKLHTPNNGPENLPLLLPGLLVRTQPPTPWSQLNAEEAMSSLKSGPGQKVQQTPDLTRPGTNPANL